LAGGIAQVASQILEGPYASCVAVFLSDLIGIPELEMRASPGGVRV
jgi:hypothetical protein